MGAIGIVAEYNPFHTGHARQLARTRELLGADLPAVAVMSGSWVQQADCAIADKWTRARLALMGGVDLVLELPTVWAVSSAESFARGAVSILNAAGVVEYLSFGSESGDIGQLGRVAACLDGGEYPALLKEQLSRGLSFPAARQRAAEQLLGTDAAVLSDSAPVTYDDYQSNIKPKPQPAEKTGWRCKVCGYVYEGAELPPDFVCPICKHGPEDFERIG